MSTSAFEKLAICQWCLPEQGPQGLLLAAELGYDGVEMDLGWRNTRRDLRLPSVLAQYLEAKEQARIQTPSLAVNSIIMNSRDRQLEARELLNHAVEVAVKLSAQTLQLPSFWDGGMRNEDEFGLTVEALRYACERAAGCGVTVTSENQLDAVQNIRLIQEVGRENFAIYYDTANPYMFDGRDGMALLRALYPHIAEIHVKEHSLHGEKPCVPLGQGGCHVQEALALIRQHGYDKWLVVENALSAAELMRDAAYVRAAMA